MKPIFLLISLCIFNIGFSQQNFHHVTKGAFFEVPMYYTYHGFMRQSQVLENKVKTVTRTIHHNKNKTIVKHHFDEDGKLILRESFGKKFTYKSYYSYNNNGKVTSIKHLSKKGEGSTLFTYDAKDQLVKTEITTSKGKKYVTEQSFNANGKIIEKSMSSPKLDYKGIKYGYSEKGEIILHQIFIKDKSNPTKELAYVRYENGSKKSTTYSKKKKVKYVWNFDCKPEGELLNIKKKDQSTICIKEEINKEGNRVVWKREFNEKGHLVKTESIFSKDSTLICKRMYTQSGRLINEYKHRDDGSTVRASFDKKGNIVFSEEVYYNKQHKQIKRVKTGKCFFRTTMISYNGDLIKSVSSINRRSTYITEYEYSFF